MTGKRLDGLGDDCSLIGTGVLVSNRMFEGVIVSVDEEDVDDNGMVFDKACPR